MLTALLQHISPVEISFSAGFFYLTAAEHLTWNSMGRPQAGGVYIAGGFNKAKVDHGPPAVGNRFVIIRYENEAAYDKFWNGGGKAWIDKNAPQARSLKVEGVEPK